MKNNPMCYIGVKEGNIENLEEEGKMRVSIKNYIPPYILRTGGIKNYPTTLTTEMDYSN